AEIPQPSAAELRTAEVNGAEIPHTEEIPQKTRITQPLQKIRITEPLEKIRIAGPVRKFGVAETPHPAEIAAEIETPRLIDLRPFDPKDIAAALMALPQERQSEVQLFWRRARYRKLGSDQNGRAVRLGIEPWKRKYSDEQRKQLIALHNGGMTIKD